MDSNAKKWHKLQQFLVLRAFNKRKAHHQTIYQQLHQLKKKKQVFVSGSLGANSTESFHWPPSSPSPSPSPSPSSSPSTTSSAASFASSPLVQKQQQEFLLLDELCEYLQIPLAQKQLLVTKFHVQGDGRIPFHEFLLFLQTPLPPPLSVLTKDDDNQQQQLPSNNGGFIIPSTDQLALVKSSTSSSTTSSTSGRSTSTSTSPASTALIQRHHRWHLQPHKPSPVVVPGMWKKREISIHEKIIEYTKIDDHGVPQLLKETEKTQTEVIHMETLTGEFAHREISHFETLEQLNDEIVHQEDGKEEFFHLKSLQDEISRFETSYPNAGNAGGPGGPGGPNGRGRYQEESVEQPPPSPSIKRDPNQTFSQVFGGMNGMHANADNEPPAPPGPAPAPAPSLFQAGAQDHEQEEARYYCSQQQRREAEEPGDNADDNDDDGNNNDNEDDDDDCGRIYAVPEVPPPYQHHHLYARPPDAMDLDLDLDLDLDQDQDQDQQDASWTQDNTTLGKETIYA